MTEPENRLLQRLYDRAGYTPSDRHKSTVLKYARQIADQKEAQNPQAQRATDARSFIKSDYLQHFSSLITAGVVTIVLFSGLHWVIAPSSIKLSHMDEPTIARFETSSPRSTNPLLDGLTIEKPVRTAATSRYSALRPIRPGTIEAVIAQQINADRDQATLKAQLIREALSEVTLLIDDGRYHAANQRYEALKLACESCLLPTRVSALNSPPYGQMSEG